LLAFHSGILALQRPASNAGSQQVDGMTLIINVMPSRVPSEVWNAPNGLLRLDLEPSEQKPKRELSNKKTCQQEDLQMAVVSTAGSENHSAAGAAGTGVLGHIFAICEPLTYAALRIALGLTLFTHGLPKLMGGGHGAVVDPFASVMNLVDTKLHLPFPIFFACCVTGIETLGALCLAAGFLTRIAAPMIAVEMAVICYIDFPVFNWLDRGLEYALLMGMMALHISMRGGGQFSIDRFLGRPGSLLGQPHSAL
jgi:putative oxidoreductase